LWSDVREVFDLFDFWDGRDGLVDGFKLGDFLRCCGLNPTCALVMENGGTKKLGKKLKLSKKIDLIVTVRALFNALESSELHR